MVLFPGMSDLRQFFNQFLDPSGDASLKVLDFSRLRATCRAHAGKKAGRCFSLLRPLRWPHVCREAFLKHLFHLVQPRLKLVMCFLDPQLVFSTLEIDVVS